MAVSKRRNYKEELNKKSRGQDSVKFFIKSFLNMILSETIVEMDF